MQGQADLMAATHSLGGENDAPSRNISRYLDSLADRLSIGLDVMLRLALRVVRIRFINSFCAFARNLFLTDVCPVSKQASHLTF